MSSADDTQKVCERIAKEQAKKFLLAAMDMLSDTIEVDPYTLVRMNQYSALVGALVNAQALVYIDVMDYAERHR